MRFFTADTHFNHYLLAMIRGFDTVEDHDECLINIWNSYVKKGDEVYHLGDFCFGTHKAVRSIRAKLHGKIHLILGNHDRTNRLHNMSETFTTIHDLWEIKIGNKPVVLCHYAMRVWSKSHYNSWQLYGHSHGSIIPIGKQYDVGLDNNRFTLLTEQDIINVMDKRENNLNYIHNYIGAGL